MPQAVENGTSVEQLSERVLELERRVAALEALRSSTRAVPSAAPTGQPGAAVPTSTGATPSAGWGGLSALSSGGTFPIIGQAVLGFAGAFLSRAITESTSFPKLPVLVVAILYACFWMVWAIRSYTANRFASITYAVTSAGILCPLVWELTVRFEVLSAPAGAVVLVGFLVLTLALADRHDLQLTPWITTLSVVITAIALIIATRELVPLTCALLAVALATETNACVGHVMTFRAIPAIVADFSVWLMVYVLAGESVPEGYRPASAGTMILICAVLPAIYGSSVGLRGFLRRQPVTVFEIAQAAIAFTLAGFGILQASHNSAGPFVGAVFGVLAAICYWGTLSRFADVEHTRNRRVFANAAAASAGGDVLIASGQCAGSVFLPGRAAGDRDLYAIGKAQPGIACVLLHSGGSGGFAIAGVCCECRGVECAGSARMAGVDRSDHGGSLLRRGIAPARGFGTTAFAVGCAGGGGSVCGGGFDCGRDCVVAGAACAAWAFSLVDDPDGCGLRSGVGVGDCVPGAQGGVGVGGLCGRGIGGAEDDV